LDTDRGRNFRSKKIIAGSVRVPPRFRPDRRGYAPLASAALKSGKKLEQFAVAGLRQA
jgi:hypothetical protein